MYSRSADNSDRGGGILLPPLSAVYTMVCNTIMMTKKNEFFKGAGDGLPIALGYLPVSFGFGIAAVSCGIDPLAAVIISLTNLTSVGQVAGISIIAAEGAYIEMILTQLIINMRYALMSLSLSQKLDDSFRIPHRLAVSYGVTDEIFAVASGKSGMVSPSYMAGLIAIPAACWVGGTLLGAFAGGILPEILKSALGILIYGMFIAIFVPASVKSKGVLVCTAAAVAVSLCIWFIPIFSFISEGFSVIICAVGASALAAWLFPVNDESGEDM